MSNTLAGTAKTVYTRVQSVENIGRHRQNSLSKGTKCGKHWQALSNQSKQGYAVSKILAGAVKTAITWFQGNYHIVDITFTWGSCIDCFVHVWCYHCFDSACQCVSMCWQCLPVFSTVFMPVTTVLTMHANVVDTSYTCFYCFDNACQCVQHSTPLLWLFWKCLPRPLPIYTHFHDCFDRACNCLQNSITRFRLLDNACHYLRLFIAPMLWLFWQCLPMHSTFYFCVLTVVTVHAMIFDTRYPSLNCSDNSCQRLRHFIPLLRLLWQCLPNLSTLYNLVSLWLPRNFQRVVLAMGSTEYKNMRAGSHLVVVCLPWFVCCLQCPYDFLTSTLALP